MKGHINILHLSDIHFKRKEKETFREDVQGKMIDAIKKHIDKYHQEPDFAAVTGDIAFSGKEYDEAKTFFKKLKSVLPAKTKFLVVPGNHDVDREKISKFFSLYSIVQYKKVDDFLEDKGEINNHINPKFKAFREFTDTLKPKLYEDEDDYFERLGQVSYLPPSFFFGARQNFCNLCLALFPYCFFFKWSLLHFNGYFLGV